jgi:hypothetical protein
MKSTVSNSAAKIVRESEDVLNYLNHAAREVRRIALASNPPFKTGAYRSSFTVRRARRATLTATMIADDRKANWLEYGTYWPTPHFDVITRATRKAGFNRVEFVAKARRGPKG